MTDPKTPEYVLTGRAPGGRLVTEIVEAWSADEAVARFEAAGHTEVVLHTDDNAARFISPGKVRNVFTPREFIGYRTRSRVGCALFLMRKLYQKAWHVDLVCLALLAVRWANGMDGGWFDALPVMVLVFPVVFAVYAELVSPAVAYKRVLYAVAWAQWDRVPRLLSRVRRLELPPYERPLREAQALAGQGRLDEALDRFAVVADDPRVPANVYWSLRAAVCWAGRDRAKVLDGFARAAELAPANAQAQVEYAVALLTLKRDTRRARAALEQASHHALSDLNTPSRIFAEAVIAYEEGDAESAVPKLEEALRLARPFSRANPAILVALARIRAYLALARLAAGDALTARRDWRRAEPILTVHDAPEVARCRELLG